MIIDNDVKPWLLVDKTRRGLGGVFYDKEAHALKVTNGKVLAILPVRDDEDDESGIIPPEALKEAAKLAAGRTAVLCAVKVKEGKATLHDGRSWPLLTEKFPDTEKVIPNAAEWARPARIRLSAELLYDLADAAGACGKFGHGVVTLEFNTDEDGDACAAPVRVTTGKASAAILMPMHFAPQKDKKASEVEPDCATCGGPGGRCLHTGGGAKE